MDVEICFHMDVERKFSVLRLISTTTLFSAAAKLFTKCSGELHSEYLMNIYEYYEYMNIQNILWIKIPGMISPSWWSWSSSALETLWRCLETKNMPGLPELRLSPKSTTSAWPTLEQNPPGVKQGFWSKLLRRHAGLEKSPCSVFKYSLKHCWIFVSTFKYVCPSTNPGCLLHADSTTGSSNQEHQKPVRHFLSCERWKGCYYSLKLAVCIAFPYYGLIIHEWWDRC